MLVKGHSPAVSLGTFNCYSILFYHVTLGHHRSFSPLLIRQYVLYGLVDYCLVRLTNWYPASTGDNTLCAMDFIYIFVVVCYFQYLLYE